MIKEGVLSIILQCSNQVHPSTILDIAKVESNLNPLAIAEIKKDRTVKSYFPSNKKDAVGVIDKIKERGNDFSVGLMQINRGNLKRFSVTEKELLDPCRNISIAEKIIIDCYKRGGNLKNALSCYYSGNFQTGQKKEKAFSNTSYVERITGKELSPLLKVIVPSTRELKQQKIKSKQIDSYAVIYPDYVVRGSVLPETITGNEDE